jgi:hypothetical protein
MQAGTMHHPAAVLRNYDGTMPNLAAGHRGLLGSLASDMALSPSTTWVPHSNRHAFILTTGKSMTNVSSVF